MLPSRKKRAHRESFGISTPPLSASQPSSFSSVSPHGRHRLRGGQLTGNTTPMPPPFKKPTLQRTVSSPFQVLSTSVRNARNPFEKLSSRAAASLPVDFTSMHGSGPEEDELNDSDETNNGDKDDSSLQIFSFSQPSLSRPTRSDEQDLDYDTEVDDDDDDNHNEEPHDMSITLNDQSSRSMLHEALAQSLRTSTIAPSTKQELELPSNIPGSVGRKKGRSETKTTAKWLLDWTLKSSLTISSKDSFEWCDSGPVTDEIDALHLFNKASLPPPSEASKTAQSPEPNAETPSNRVQVMSTLYHWVYPANVPDAVQARAIGRLLKSTAHMSLKERESIVEIFTRNSEWRQSFCNVYQLFRNSSCPYFYYVGTSFAVLFQSESVSLSGELEAILTHSTRGLQETLNKEHIVYEVLPDITGTLAQDHIGAKHDLDNIDDDNDDDDDNDEDDDDDDNDEDDDDDDNGTTGNIDKHRSDHASNGDKKRAKRESPSSSLSSSRRTSPLSNVLHFKGRMRVHSLFDFLLNYKLKVDEGRLYHSPTLIAGVPFLHSSLKRAQLSKSRRVSKQVAGTTERVERENRIDIQGIVLPTQLKAFVEVMAKQQAETGYSFQSTSQPITHGVNLRPLTDENPTASDGGDYSDGSEHQLYLKSSRGQDQFRYNPTSRLYSWIAT